MVHKKVGTFTTMVSVGTQCYDCQISTGPEVRDVAVNTEELAGFDDSTADVPSYSEPEGEPDSFKDVDFSLQSNENATSTGASDKTDDEELGNEQPSHDTKYVVFWSCLLPSWYSTARIPGMSLGNLELSGSILYTGSTFKMMSLCNISFLGRTNYHAIQKQILSPTVNDFMTTLENNLFP